MSSQVPSTLFQNFSDPAVSMFQSATAAADARERTRTGPQPSPAVPQAADHTAPLVQATANAAQALVGRGGDGGGRCADAYLKLALAQARGNAAEIAAAQANLPAFGDCDEKWSEALGEFLLHYSLVKHSDVPYRRWKSLDDFVVPASGDAAPVLPDPAKVAIIGDWGTGEPRAQALLQAVASYQPNIVIHLGDIYYSCDMREADAFYRNMTAVFPPASTRVFTLCGNHDMYSGGTPYYALLDRIGQPASLFCLRNAFWQLLAMDTGYNDFNPFKVNTAATWVQDGTDESGQQAADPYSELAWHNDKLLRADGRRTVMLSHHPLFTRNSPIVQDQVLNPRLYAQVRSWLPEIALWLWGHEHNMVVYQPFAGLQRGRCMGASAIPVLSTTSIYTPSPDFSPGQAIPELLNPAATCLPRDQASGLYDLAFGVLSLAGSSGKMTYYRFNQTDGPSLAWEEAI